ncbi:MAG: 2-(1,2-epoxy,2-dihydrophenyl)acetyl-CoA isomerase [Actinomycetota bacterium]|jgi:2-(1,2-epoxy-1,2-dihydrophenyl)acetyl-CoA isomerase|nr:2-(1,2-epoxy,2-dihydrophenyl)acetyl-CoA isomerase [Actinomycetota bacterium]
METVGALMAALAGPSGVRRSDPVREDGSERAPAVSPEDALPPEGGVGIEIADAVATITIATARGALDTRAKTALRDGLERIASDVRVRAVVLTGVGRTFCVGQDLVEHSTALADDATAAWDTLREHYNPIVTSLATMPKPVIAAVNGVAAGAGASFAFACDLRLIADDAAFHLAFAAVGLSPDSGLSWTLPRLIGHGRAAELLLRPRQRPIPASDAVLLGLVHAVVPAADLHARARELALELAAGPTVAYGAAKQAMAYSAGHGLVDALDMEAGLQTLAGTTEDHAGAVAAFLEKRPPTFRGR